MRRVLFGAALLFAACGGAHGPSTSPAVDAGTGAGDDAAPPSAFVLAAGEAAEVPMGDDGVGRIKLAASGGEKFVVVLGSTKLDEPFGAYPYRLSLEPIDGDTTARRLEGCALSSADWSKLTPTSEPAPSGAAPALGTKRRLEMSETIDAEVVAITKTAVVWADVTAAHPAKLDAAFLDAFLKDWDALILPRERAVFGVESDLDGDGHIGLVFSPLTYDSAVAYFTGCDLKNLAGCGRGNGGEFLYLTPPEVIAPPYGTPAAMKEILAHETGHLLHFNRKVLRNGLTDGSDSGYMAEGLGALAQDVIGFQAGNLYVTKAGLDQLDAFSLADLFKERAAYDPKRDGPMRGGAYLFARWLYDRGGGDLTKEDGTVESKGGPALIRALLDARESVTAALTTVAKANAPDVAMDFFTTLAMSNRETAGGVAPRNPCFAYLPTASDPVTDKRRGADVFAAFHGQKMNGPKLQPFASPSGTIRNGGVELFVLDATAAGELHVTVNTDPISVPRLRIARIR